MKFKIKKYPEVRYENEFLIFPKKFGEYKYWWCWVTVQYVWISALNRYSKISEIVSLGKHATEYNKQFHEM